jgi:hypothetical protein
MATVPINAAPLRQPVLGNLNAAESSERFERKGK